MNTSPTERFTERVENYVKYRPGYPHALLDCLREEYGLTAVQPIADVGSGTGLLAELFVRHGNPVYGVEPNEAMRAAGEAYLAAYANFSSLAATAEATTLPDESVNWITAGQAFHWFDLGPTQKEFRRILKPGGYVALVWNERDVTGSAFMAAYEALLQPRAAYNQSTHRNKDDDLTAFFAQHRQHAFNNGQQFDFAGLKGRTLSSSYTPLPDEPDYEPFLNALWLLFERYAENGRVAFLYRTQLYIGQLPQ
jgi:SAM-dependent methyltransferase